MFVLSTVPYQHLMIRHLDFFVGPCERQHHSEVDSFVSSVPHLIPWLSLRERLCNWAIAWLHREVGMLRGYHGSGSQ